MNPLGARLFPEKRNTGMKTRFAESMNINSPVPGYPNLPTNMMAKIWNNMPGIQTATTLGAVKSLARKWAKTIPR